MKRRSYNSITKELRRLIQEYNVCEDEKEDEYISRLVDIAKELNDNKEFFDGFSYEYMEKRQEELLNSNEHSNEYKIINVLIREKKKYELKATQIADFYADTNLKSSKILLSNNKYKKAMLALGVIGLVGVMCMGTSKITGDASNSLNKEATEVSNDASADELLNEVTTELVKQLTTEKATEVKKEKSKDVSKDASKEATFDTNNKEEVSKIVDENYNKYKKSYEKIGISKKELTNIFYFINNRTDKISDKELLDAAHNINSILLPQDAINVLVAVNNRKNKYSYDKNARMDYSIPSLNSFVSNENKEALDDLYLFYACSVMLNGNLQANTYSKTLVSSINKTVVDQELNKDIIDMVEQHDNLGVSYLVSSSRLALITYAKLINPDDVYITQSRSNEIFKVKIRESEDELELQSKLTSNIARSGKTPSKNDFNEYIENKNKLITTKYENIADEIVEQAIINYNKNNVLTYKNNLTK